MADVQDTIRERAAALLSSGEVSAVVGWGAGRFDDVRFPLVIKRAEDAGKLVFDASCVQMTAKRLLEHTGEGKVALVARGCESRAVNRFIADHQLTRDQVYVIGVPCPGMVDPATGETLKRCAECQVRNPVVHDELVGDPVPEPKPYRFAEVDRVEAMSREERRAFFDEMYGKCIRCYACRNACPCCTCRECFVEQDKVGWQGKAFNVNEARYYGMIRAFHTGDRCIECGECERACPMGLPLMVIMHQQVRDIDKLFGPYEGGGLTDSGPDPLRTYKTDDIEEFM